MIHALKEDRLKDKNQVFFKFDFDQIMARMGIDTKSQDRFIRSLPFFGNDATAGTENELQTIVSGRRKDVDLPRIIEESNYYMNLVKQARAGDTSEKRVMALERFLKEKKDRNSVVSG
ncbi:MAG: hypothetical protein HUK40_14000 [Desulfobacter sp.]|nr:hypothetical protein [Desulfobacter sp.]WDP87737.1 MAG: hypothetical protein HUN05_23525 [Desulfobacter sp.]